MTPQVKSEGLATMMKVVQKEMKVPMMRTQLSSRLHAFTTGVFQYFHNTPGVREGVSKHLLFAHMNEKR